MSNDDKRRRQDGSTAKLSVADLLARREAETQPIPRITDGGAVDRTTVGGAGDRTTDRTTRGAGDRTGSGVGDRATDTAGRRTTGRTTDDEETVRFSTAALAAGATNLSGRELHITELLRREGRAGEEERGGGFSVPKLVAMAGGGVVLAGTVAFTATNLMSSPDERPLAEVRFDARPAARATNSLTQDLGAAAAKQQEVQQQTQAETTTTTPEQRAAQAQAQAQQTPTQRAPQPTTQQPTTTTAEQAPTTQSPSSSSSRQTTTPAPSTTTPAPPSDSSQPPSSSVPPSSSQPSTPPSDDSGIGLDVGLDLGGILNPIGGFDFFAPAG